MHSGLLNVNDTWKMDAARQKHRYLFKAKLILSVLFYSFFFFSYC